jgi:hypothetical protein
MPAAEGLDGLSQEQKLTRACLECLRRQKLNNPPNIKAVALDFDVPYSTLYARFKNVHKSRQEARQSQQFLTPAQELVLAQWIEHLGATGVPLDKKAIRARAQKLHPDGKRPGKNWARGFLKRNPAICLATGSGLDPKRAKAFNRPVVDRYFQELAALIEKHDIPAENIYTIHSAGT